MYSIKHTSKDIFHIVRGEASSSMLSRYGILPSDGEFPLSPLLETPTNGSFALSTNKRKVIITVSDDNDGYSIAIGLSEKERLFGLGDATRDCVMVRGIRASMDIANVSSYGPLTVLLSSDGWGFILNSTYPSVFDCDSKNDGSFTAYVSGGAVDFYLILGDSLAELLNKATSVIGRPCMLPKFAYGLTFVENELTNVQSLLWDIKNLRERNIPCDTIGLEPSWMETHYDFSTNKKWNKKLFPFPDWLPENYAGDFSFLYPMREMGMQLSLWLCNNYDMIYNEESSSAADKAEGFSNAAVIQDARLQGSRRMDRITKPTESWFEHLKKFVDNGAAAFKLDGGNQVLSYSDRLWGGKYTDSEVHNANPVLLVKNMHEGFKDYTGRRLLLYTAAAFIGTQKYAATWAGDTGGGQETMISLMNYAMCGHSNTSCDIDVTNVEAIHYGFLTPWAQYFCWANWKYPWFLSPKLESCIIYYANLRSSLIPYIYTMAHTANVSGMPILRPLPLVYNETDKFDNVKNAYMLGDSLYVGAFDMNLSLPDGDWVDYFTGRVYNGDIFYDIPNGRGGALLAKSGSIVVTMKPQKYVLEKEHDYIVKLFPGRQASFELYEDDGFTYDFEKGLFATTLFEMTDENENGFTLTVHPRQGSYPGRPDGGHNIVENSIPDIPPIPPCRDMLAEVVERSVKAVVLNDRNIEFECVENAVRFTIPADIHTKSTLRYKIIYN